MADKKYMVDRQKTASDSTHIFAGHYEKYGTNRGAAYDDNLPHIQSIKAGFEKYDPVHKSIFEVTFSVPPAIQSIFTEDVILLRQQVLTVGGLDALQKTTAAGSQKFFGVDVSFLNPTLDNTYADITIVFNLNLRNVTDNYVLKLFRAWENLSYDLADGTRGIKMDYCAPSLQIAEANRNGDVWRSYQFNDVMLTGVTGRDDLDYTNNDAQQLTCVFRSDYWYDTFAAGTPSAASASANYPELSLPNGKA